jgi:hypothetical protein
MYIPIINPYNDLFVPEPGLFNFAGDATLPAFLQCSGPSATDPGNSKYFAIVKVDSNTIHIYKAYRNYPTDDRWVWRLIGNSPDQGDIDTITLDNCGRVVECPGVTGCSADEISTDGGATWTPVAVSTRVDPSNNTFYGWNPDNNYQTDTCPANGETETIPDTPYVDFDGIASNNWNQNDFPQYTGHTGTTINTALHSTFGLGYAEALPGVKNAANDAIGDFDTSFVIRNGGFSTSGNDLYSPLYNGVIWVFGSEVNLGGNISHLAYNNSGVQATIEIDDDAAFDLNATWRITIITTGSIDAGGTVNINPRRMTLIIAGL